ncbi:MAG: TIGR01777 family protein [Flavobacteriales bacterium]|nr:TIGR01777 family protein [Flavobacteriia bacterium]NCP06085.1 TIGR01777 family protein [Flavobacteriales bacterium]PIV94852.1 MAG: TIGR01777 family protein [Flavobacteriaceae bacterium CG17_big_fil_post_rev_8_21_14_2_50_33_15]PIY10113.1 MAG: TIGR01777 family protein [Flavobacteriaceae bacterium CG_4_10_14_3_um_filter_33_47]PJB18019.1 MAG: TIGR01777 family protein [Flavobacteriaceae bacterium CG_4_9_14_3_um_filter_33_16]
MRVLITGATGLIGKEIVRLCHKQAMDVHYLTTSKSKISNQQNYKGFYWNPKNNEIDIQSFENVDTIFHLAGATVSKRWTSSYKQEILSSRLEATQTLVNALKNNPNQVKHIISASAIGLYPDSISNYYEEDHSKGDDTFLSNVVKQWEAAVDEFSNLNMMVSKIRIGLVLSNKGGALPEILKPIKLGLGSSFGTGQAWQSWIHINDLARLFLFVYMHHLEGAYNAVAPNAVSNQELTKLCAKVLDKPLFMPNIPKILMKLVLGEMHTLLFLSQRVSSKKIEEAGFEFKYHHLQPALEALLK